MSTFRAWFYLSTLPYLAIHYHAALWNFPSEAWRPLYLFRLFSLPSVTQSLAPYAYLSLALLLLLAAAGKLSRLTEPLSFLLALWVLGSRYNYGVLHSQLDAPLVLALGLLAFPLPDPRTAIRLLLVFVIFSAGLFKLLSTGFAWIRTDALSPFLELRYGREPHFFPARFLLEHPIFTRLASAGTIVFELCFPVSLLHERAGLWLTAMLALFLSFTFFLLGHNFLLSLLPLLGAFYPWERIVSHPRAKGLKFFQRHQ